MNRPTPIWFDLQVAWELHKNIGTSGAPKSVYQRVPQFSRFSTVTLPQFMGHPLFLDKNMWTVIQMTQKQMAFWVCQQNNTPKIQMFNDNFIHSISVIWAFSNSLFILSSQDCGMSLPRSIARGGVKSPFSDVSPIQGRSLRGSSKTQADWFASFEIFCPPVVFVGLSDDTSPTNP